VFEAYLCRDFFEVPFFDLFCDDFAILEGVTPSSADTPPSAAPSNMYN